MAIRLLKASWAGLVAVAVGGLKPPVLSLPEVLVDSGVFRPEAKGEGVGWSEGKEGYALDGFIGGFFCEVLDVADADQSMPARSSIVAADEVEVVYAEVERPMLGYLVDSKASKHVMYGMVCRCRGAHEQRSRNESIWEVYYYTCRSACWPLVACRGR